MSYSWFCSAQIYTVLQKKVYHPTFNNNFNSSLVIIGTVSYMPSRGGLTNHLTCFLYAYYLGKLSDRKNHEHSSCIPL